VWIAGKPPSEDVIAMLRSYGIAPDHESGSDDESGSEEDDADDVPRLIGTGVLADVARRPQGPGRPGREPVPGLTRTLRADGSDPVAVTADQKH
jgi:hypothetical protein